MNFMVIINKKSPQPSILVSTWEYYYPLVKSLLVYHGEQFLTSTRV